MIRFTLKHLLLLTALVAVCAVTFTKGGWFWARLLFTIALAVQLGAVLAALFLRGRPRAFWTGFALFGWTAWLIANYPVLQVAEHQLFVEEIAKLLKEYMPETNDGVVKLSKMHQMAIFSFERTLHAMFGLVFGFLGGILGALIYSSANDDRSRPN